MAHEEYKQRIMDHFNAVLDADLNLDPNYATMKMVFDIIKHQMPWTLAARAICRTHIQVSDEIFEDTEFMEYVSNAYAGIIVNLYQHSEETYKSEECFLDLVAGISLTLAP